MYEQYTDEQIIEMLKPKLNKCTTQIDWDVVTSEPDSLWGQMFWGDILKAISIVYRSGYIRGQLGRSFIIGEKNKQNGCWVPVNKDNVKVGSKVRFINEHLHKKRPQYFPCKNVIGEVVWTGEFGACGVLWPCGSTSGTDAWYAKYEDLEVLLCK